MSAQLLTLDGERQTMPEETVEELRATFHGPVLTSEDDDYDDIRVVQNGMVDRRPGVIIRCAGVADVVDAVTLAHDRDLLASVRGGGHSIAGTSVADDCLMIDLSEMRAVWVDPDQRRVRVAGGATWADVDREAQLHGLAVPGGVMSTTGVAGLTLGGGIGWLHRKYGLTCDSLVAAEVVTPDGRLLRTDVSQHPDLFWALRGGGGNFGVVVAFEFDAYPVGPTVWNGAVMYAAEDAPEVLPRWRDWTLGLPDEITSRAMFWFMPEAPVLPPEVHDREVLVTAALYAGDPADGERACAPLAQFGTPLADLSGAVPYRAAQSDFDAFFPKGGLQSYWKSVYLDQVDDDAIDFILGIAGNRPHPLTLIHVPMLGGATAQVDAADTAFGDRSPDYLLSIDGNWLDPVDNDDNIAWVREAYAGANELEAASGTYLNFGGDRDIGESDRRRAFGRNLRRLREVKRTYDPDNRFRMNANIPPAAG